MTAPPQGSGQPYPPGSYPGPAYYAPMNIENMLTKRTLWVLNAVGIAGIWIGLVIALLAANADQLKFAYALVFTGGAWAALVSLAGALGSRKTTDMQNVGLIVWAALVFTASMSFVFRFF